MTETERETGRETEREGRNEMMSSFENSEVCQCGRNRSGRQGLSFDQGARGTVSKSDGVSTNHSTFLSFPLNVLFNLS